MKTYLLTTGIALAALIGIASAANAQPPEKVPVVPGKPQVITWPGGYMIIDGKGGVIVRHTDLPGAAKAGKRLPGSTNIISGSGNGIGNSITIGGGPGTTIVQNSRNGIGNKLVIPEGSTLIDLDFLFPWFKHAVPVVPEK